MNYIIVFVIGFILGVFAHIFWESEEFIKGFNKKGE